MPEPRRVVPDVFDIEVVDDPFATGHLLMRSAQYELALRAFTRALGEGDVGPPGAIEAALGTANAGLGRMPTAERYLDAAVAKDPSSVESWNNLGVVAMSRGKLNKARNAFLTAFALSDGTSDTARKNLARLDEREADSAIPSGDMPAELTLVRQGSGRYLLDTPSSSGGTQ